MITPINFCGKVYVDKKNIKLTDFQDKCMQAVANTLDCDVFVVKKDDDFQSPKLNTYIVKDEVAYQKTFGDVDFALIGKNENLKKINLYKNPAPMQRYTLPILATYKIVQELLENATEEEINELLSSEAV